MCKLSQNVCKCMLMKQTVQLWKSQINLFNNLINLWNWGCWRIVCSKCFFPDTSCEGFFDKISSKTKCWFIFFFFPSVKVANSITLCYYSLWRGSLYNCEFWQAAKCSCMIVPWAETYWYLRIYSNVIFVNQGKLFPRLVHTRHVLE